MDRRTVVVAVGAVALLLALPHRPLDGTLLTAPAASEVAFAPVLDGPTVFPPEETGEEEPTTTTAAPAPSGSATPTTRRVIPTTARPTATTTTAAASDSDAASAAAPYALHYNDDGSVVRWDPCAAITWKANLGLAPPGALEEVAAAVDALGRATGMAFAYGGTTTAVPTEEWLHTATDPRTIVVAWVPAASSDLFTDGADAQGGWYEQGSSRDGRDWTWQIVRGFVVLDPLATADYAAGFGEGVTRGALLMHELAHAVGLSHVEDRSQLMYPTLGKNTTARYASGDLAGLARVGRDAGCIS